MPQYEDEEFIDAMVPGKHTSTEIVASRVGCTVQTANKRLKKLADVDEGARIEFTFPQWLEAHPSSRQDLLVRRVPEGEDPLYTPPSMKPDSAEKQA